MTKETVGGAERALRANPFEDCSPASPLPEAGSNLKFEDQAGLDEGGRFCVKERTLNTLA